MKGRAQATAGDAGEFPDLIAQGGAGVPDHVELCLLLLRPEGEEGHPIPEAHGIHLQGRKDDYAQVLLHAQKRGPGVAHGDLTAPDVHVLFEQMGGKAAEAPLSDVQDELLPDKRFLRHPGVRKAFPGLGTAFQGAALGDSHNHRALRDQLVTESFSRLIVRIRSS